MTVLITILLVLILVSLCGGFYALVKQQGRILLRLDQLEQNAKPGATAAEMPQEAEPGGLPLGTDFPAFKFPALDGNEVALENFRGNRVLLVHWNFQCGFCESIAPELAAMSAALEQRNVQLVLLSYGDTAANQEGAARHGLKCPILLVTNNDVPEPFSHRGTPVAYLLNEQGQIAAPFASGADQVLSLARDLAHVDIAASPSNEPRSQIGTDFPPFAFPNLAGEIVKLEDFRGRRLLLVNWNFECGFCDAIAPELARLEASLERAAVELVLLSRGDAQSNREQAAENGLSCRILLLQGREKPRPFEHRGTPVAYLLDEQGRIAAPFASGSENVVSLAREAAHLDRGAPSAESSEFYPASEAARSNASQNGQQRHRIKIPQFLFQGEIGLGDVIKRLTAALGIKTCVGCERRAAVLNRWVSFSGLNGGGIAAGRSAPGFRLPDLQGRTVSLDDYRGKRVLLVFTDPHCGPCDELAPDLVRLHEAHTDNGLAVVLVGRGKVEENRRKAELHGFRFPVVVQEKWKVSKAYGTLATPVAFLIGEDGVIASDAAAGRQAILDLVREGAA